MINFDERLDSLKDRRQGIDTRVTREKVAKSKYDSYNFSLDSYTDSRQKESYEEISESKSIKYIYGAMEEVSTDYTQESKNNGVKVADILINSLYYKGIYVEYKFQGSVAANTHIERHSDIDVLFLLKDVLTVERPHVYPSRYVQSTDFRSMNDIVKDLRLRSEFFSVSHFRDSKVIIDNNKSISLEGGILTRKVDIVPAHWHDRKEYQLSGLEKDREVRIYNKQTHELIGNWPFLHIYEINQKDKRYNGNLRRVIRLVKNIVADMKERKTIAQNLSSYDIAAICYHMNGMLDASETYLLSLFNSVVEYFSSLSFNESYAKSLIVPDKSRKILDKDEKYLAIYVIWKELSDIAKQIHRELKPYSSQEFDRNTLLEKYVRY